MFLLWLLEVAAAEVQEGFYVAFTLPVVVAAVGALVIEMDFL